MTARPLTTRTWVLTLAALAIPLSAICQTLAPTESPGGPLKARVVAAPFTATATTTVTRLASNGIRVRESATARYYRDSDGRVRIEQTVYDSSAAGIARTLVIVAPNPGEPMVYALDSDRRTIRLLPRDLVGSLFSGGPTFAIPRGLGRYSVFRGDDLFGLDSAAMASAAEPLGTGLIDGVSAVGRRILSPTATSATGPSDERWESSELALVVYARTVDGHAGTFDYRLSDIRRGEPAKGLFVVPDDFERVQGADATGRPWLTLDFRRPD